MIYLNEEPVPYTRFPDGTSQVWKLPENMLQLNKYAEVRWEFDIGKEGAEGEFMRLAQLKALLDEDHMSVHLHISYLPYGRQDKPVRNQNTFGLKPFTQLLNALNFKTVSIEDPHSCYPILWIKNSKPIYPIKQIKKIFKDLKCDLVCYPDYGAESKYSSFFQFPSISANKCRNSQTGEVNSVKIYDQVDLIRGKKVLIVDDICDGGATFILLANSLKKHGVDAISLFVSHGIFSKGKQVLLDAGIDPIFTGGAE